MKTLLIKLNKTHYKSRSQENIKYTTTRTMNSDTKKPEVKCDCLGFRYHKKCWHSSRLLLTA